MRRAAVGHHHDREADRRPPRRHGEARRCTTTGGITFQAAEGGEEDIRLRGFSLAASGDIYIDSVRDPAFYDRDVFNFDRVEVLRGSASMLFGRGSTGGVVNQVSKQPILAERQRGADRHGGTGKLPSLRPATSTCRPATTSAVRLNVMTTYADNDGNTIDKYGVAPTFRWGIGTPDEFSVGLFYLQQRQRHQLRPALAAPELDAGRLGDATRPAWSKARPEELLRRRERLQRRRRARYGTAQLDASLRRRRRAAATILRHGRYDRDQRASTIRFCSARQQQRQPRLPGRRAVAGHGQRRVPAHARHQQQGAEHDDHLPADRLQQQLQPGSA